MIWESVDTCLIATAHGSERWYVLVLDAFGDLDDASLMDKATFGEARLSKEMEADISTVQLGGSCSVVSQAKKM